MRGRLLTGRPWRTVRRLVLLAGAALALGVAPGVLHAFGVTFVPVVAGETSAVANPIALFAADVWRQVRIEQHLIIRIGPADPALVRDPGPPPPPPQVPLRARRIAPCLPVVAIAAARPLSDRSLLLMLHDRRLVAADLSRTCTARDFILGFYVPSTPDGQLCVKRDVIHSRYGPSCTITRVRELVPQY